jgi:glucose 1-dehydrogenase/3-oxoacyl-[acyl-carrier protein] reductase
MESCPYSLEGKLVLVTGAGTGIGKGIALEVARQGADVAINYASSETGALEAVDDIIKMGRRAIAIQGNLSQVDECFRVVDQAVAFLGGLDGLVNNAGITLKVDFLDMTEELWNQVFHLNARGEYFTAQRAVPYMLKRGEELRQFDPERHYAGGSIINISSVHGYAGCPGHSAYASTKGAINSFSRELAIELCQAHIRVNVLAPGSIEVPSYFKVDSNYNREEGNNLVPWGRIGLPQDVGYLAAFMLSDAAEFLTGQVIYFDGGLTAKMALPVKPAQGKR